MRYKSTRLYIWCQTAAHDSLFSGLIVVSVVTESSFHPPGVLKDNEYVGHYFTSGKDPSFTKRFEARTNIYIA